MAKTTLPTNYVDDVLNGAMDGKRRYREIPNADGTISLEDATAYDQVGSNFGAAQLNLMSENINQSFDSNKMLKTMDEVNTVTQEGYGVDALVVKQVNTDLGGLKFGKDGDGNYGYYGDDDVLIPFKGGSSIIPIGNNLSSLTTQTIDITSYYNKYEQLTSDNFLARPVSYSGRFGTAYDDSGPWTQTYDANTGTLTIGEFHQTDGGQPVQHYILYDLYLVV